MPERDVITGREIKTFVLNKKNLTSQELDDYFLADEILNGGN